MVDQGLCISNFSPSKLSSSGKIFYADNEEGIKNRNTMHNRLVADAFIPAGGKTNFNFFEIKWPISFFYTITHLITLGISSMSYISGRPGTIDMTNYKKYLKEDGKPSSPLIVEGANLFVTDDARQKLYDEGGVVIVKDSSANKCGVITSSYEICAAMLLSEEEFYENKEQIVGEVVDKLRELAKMEAELLFKEFDIHEGMSLNLLFKIYMHQIMMHNSYFEMSAFSQVLCQKSARK